jgi:hypothetical protein
MRVQDQVVPIIYDAVRNAQAAGALPAFDLQPRDVVAERPRTAGHGDLARALGLMGMNAPKEM